MNSTPATPGNSETLGLDPALLAIIVCPQCHGALLPVAQTAFEGADGELVCQGSCGNAYPVKDGIPVLLVDEARTPA